MTSRPTSKGRKKAVSSGNVTPTSSEPLLFTSLHFYFFPNSRTNRARALRIDKAIQHGAVFSSSLNPKVTHVIMDDGMQWDEFTKYHKDHGMLGEAVIVANERYIADCLACGILLDHKQRIYQIPGRDSDGVGPSKLRKVASAPDLTKKAIKADVPKLSRSKTDQAVPKSFSEPYETFEVDSIVDVIGKPNAPRAKEQIAEPNNDARLTGKQPQYEDELAAMISEAKATSHLVCSILSQKQLLDANLALQPVDSTFDDDLPATDLQDSILEPTTSTAASTLGKNVGLASASKSSNGSDPMIMQRPSDGIWVKLRCKACGESKFEHMKSFLKHCAFKHKHRFKTQDQAIEEWGFPVKLYALGAASSPPVAPSVVSSAAEDEIPAESSVEAEEETQERPAKRAKKSWQDQFVCMDKHDKDTKEENPNAYVIEQLQEMANYYERTGDRWRTLSFRKGLSTLKRQERKITTKEEALKLPNVGSSIAESIEKIVQTGKLQRLEATKEDPLNDVHQLFMGVYGVGLVQANKWVSAGYRTLDDLREKADLSDTQKVGLDHYDDLQQRVPRAEVEAHGNIFRSTLAGIDSAFEVTIGGSYRRGSPTSGDIDLIITKREASLHQIRTVILEQIVPELFEMGFLKAELARTSNDTGSKWHGCSAINDGPWRRIDFLLVPWDEMGAALIYFTGNDIFNRSIRLLASRKGMRLNQRGLYRDVIRGKGRERITAGELLESKSEKKIFEILSVPWRPPEHRNA
jgi:DNA polymerase/3'-5' exonuclease PolX